MGVLSLSHHHSYYYYHRPLLLLAIIIVIKKYDNNISSSFMMMCLLFIYYCCCCGSIIIIKVVIVTEMTAVFPILCVLLQHQIACCSSYFTFCSSSSSSSSWMKVSFSLLMSARNADNKREIHTRTNRRFPFAICNSPLVSLNQSLEAFAKKMLQYAKNILEKWLLLLSGKAENDNVYSCARWGLCAERCGKNVTDFSFRSDRECEKCTRLIESFFPFGLIESARSVLVAFLSLRPPSVHIL